MLPFFLLAAEAVTPEPPAISPEIAAEFWRARTMYLEAAAVAKERESEATAARDKLIKACGADHTPADDGRALKCVPKEKPKP